MEQHQIPITPENAEYIVGELDRKMDMLFDGDFPQDYFFLAGGGAVLLYRPMDENRIRYQSKDLDFIWIQNWQYDNFLWNH